MWCVCVRVYGFGAALFARTPLSFAHSTSTYDVTNLTSIAKCFTNKLFWLFWSKVWTFFQFFFRCGHWAFHFLWFSGVKAVTLIFFKAVILNCCLLRKKERENPLIFSHVVVVRGIKRIWQWHWIRATNCLMPNHKKTHAQINSVVIFRSKLYVLLIFAKRKDTHRIDNDPSCGFTMYSSICKVVGVTVALPYIRIKSNLADVVQWWRSVCTQKQIQWIENQLINKMGYKHFASLIHASGAIKKWDNRANLFVNATFI